MHLKQAKYFNQSERIKRAHLLLNQLANPIHPSEERIYTSHHPSFYFYIRRLPPSSGCLLGCVEVALKVRPLTLDGLLLEVLPTKHATKSANAVPYEGFEVL